MDFARVIKTDRLLRIVLLSLLILIAGGAAFAWGGDASVDLFKRAFLANVPVPRKTRVLSITDNLLIARGDNVEILAIADGVVPDTGRLTLKTDAGRKQDFTLDRITLDPRHNSSPAFRITTATIGTPPCIAMWNAPFLNRPTAGVAERVPSGEIAIE